MEGAIPCETRATLNERFWAALPSVYPKCKQSIHPGHSLIRYCKNTMNRISVGIIGLLARNHVMN